MSATRWSHRTTRSKELIYKSGCTGPNMYSSDSLKSFTYPNNILGKNVESIDDLRRHDAHVTPLNGPLARCVKLLVAHAPGMPGIFLPPPRVCDPDMTHVPWCMLGSLTRGFLWSRWRGKRSHHSRRMRKPQFYVSRKRPKDYDISVPHRSTPRAMAIRYHRDKLALGIRQGSLLSLLLQQTTL